MHVPYDPEISYLGVCPKDILTKSLKTRTELFMTTLEMMPEFPTGRMTNREGSWAWAILAGPHSRAQFTCDQNPTNKRLKDGFFCPESRGSARRRARLEFTVQGNVQCHLPKPPPKPVCVPWGVSVCSPTMERTLIGNYCESEKQQKKDITADQLR